jgi:uncharacterized protein (TIGR02266 family)
MGAREMSERESRESSRIEGVFRVKYPTVDRLVIAYSRDFSRGGMFLATEQFLPINAVIRLEIDLPDEGGRIPVTCRVAYVRDQPSAAASGKPVGMGVQFLDLDQGGLSRLASFVADRTAAWANENVSEHARGRPLDVLIVDDDKSWADRAGRAFRERGDKVRTAFDGLHGLAECLKRPPDVVVSDVEMPRMDGWQLIRILRSRPSLSSIPVLFLSQVWGENERLRGYKSGIDDFIAKPFGPEELVARVDRAVERAERPGPTLTQRKTLRGDLGQVSIASVLSFLELEKRTGVLLLVGQKTARIYIDGGRPLKIEIDGARSTESPRSLMDRVLDWTEGQFEFGAQDVACADELRTSLTAILLDHARVEDESQS